MGDPAVGATTSAAATGEEEDKPQSGSHMGDTVGATTSAAATDEVEDTPQNGSQIGATDNLSSKRIRDENNGNQSLSSADGGSKSSRKRRLGSTTTGGSTHSASVAGEDPAHRAARKRPRQDDDEEADVPVKEIHMSRKEREEEERKRKLDPVTMALLRGAVQTVTPEAYLNDDEIVTFIKSVDRAARHQTHAGGLTDDSDGSIMDELVAEEEDLALGHEIFSKAISSIRKNSPVGTVNGRTVDWVRRASGLQRKKLETLIRENFELDDHDTTGDVKNSRRRTTRAAARSTRAERRDKGLGILSSVVDELEGKLGPYPARVKPPRPAGRGTKRAYMLTDADRTPKTKNRKKGALAKEKARPKPPTRRTRGPSRRRPVALPQTNGHWSPEQRQPLIRHRPSQKWEDVWPIETHTLPLQFPPRRAHDSTTYARKSLEILKYLSWPVLAWSRFEYFYGDIDRAWYG
jgi:hypothetical protein